MDGLEALKNDQGFLSAPPQEQAQYLREVVLPKADPGFAKASPQDQEAYVNEVVLPKLSAKVSQTQAQPITAPAQDTGPNPVQGIGNVLGAIGQGVLGAGKALVNPATYAGIAQNVGTALSTEWQNREMEAEGKLPDPQHYGRPWPTDLIAGGGRQLINGVTGLPSDIANAYQGRPAYQNAWEIPASPREQYLRQNYPATMGLGDQLPYALPILGEAKLGRAAAEGAAIGALQNPEGGGLSARVGNAAAGAIVPTAIKGVGKGLKAGLRFERQPVRDITPATPPAQKPVRVTGKDSNGFLYEEIPQNAYLYHRTLPENLESLQKSNIYDPSKGKVLYHSGLDPSGKSMFLTEEQGGEWLSHRSSSDGYISAKFPTNKNLKMLVIEKPQDMARLYSLWEGGSNVKALLKKHGSKDFSELQAYKDALGPRTLDIQAIKSLGYDGVLFRGEAGKIHDGAQAIVFDPNKSINFKSEKPALQALHSSVDEFHAQPTKNYKALAGKAKQLANQLTPEEFESAMGKLSQDDLNAVGRLVGC